MRQEVNPWVAFMELLKEDWIQTFSMDAQDYYFFAATGGINGVCHHWCSAVNVKSKSPVAYFPIPGNKYIQNGILQSNKQGIRK